MKYPFAAGPRIMHAALRSFGNENRRGARAAHKGIPLS